VLQRLLRKVVWTVTGRVLTSNLLVYNPYLSGKYFPIQAGEPHVVVDKPTPAGPAPVPPVHMWEGYGATSDEYLGSGRADVQTMLGLLEAAGADPGRLRAVLDLGCSAGRMLRFFPGESGRSELWGVDLKSEHITWCQQHLTSPFHFATTTTAPHLPFEDGYFDLVYCGSVFTHIADLADAWLLEIRRILRRGGYAYITIHDRQSIRLLFGKYRDRPDLAFVRDVIRRADAHAAVRSRDYAYFLVGREPGVQVFYDVDYLVGRWSPVMEVRSVTEGAHDYQAALVLRKRDDRL
jgi:SAM-dependent methyltransferase